VTEIGRGQTLLMLFLWRQLVLKKALQAALKVIPGQSSPCAAPPRATSRALMLTTQLLLQSIRLLSPALRRHALTTVHLRNL
jgi:hypothetical protein